MFTFTYVPAMNVYAKEKCIFLEKNLAVFFWEFIFFYHITKL